ncbi:MAG TPA: CHAD domain-containing protein [Thermoanaerobaculia bacterium]|nr:CHAD domain-containing protein [Thermoanaerobaculia bacterium]
MSFEIQEGEELQTGIRRVAIERLEEAITCLGDESASLHDRIHDARKRFKEARSVARVVRVPLGVLYDLENGWFREEGRSLSAFRDAEALLESVRKWRDEITSEACAESFEKLEGELTRNQEASSANDVEERMSQIALDCQDAILRIDAWPLSGITWSDIAPAVESTYRRSRRAFRNAAGDGTALNFHEWRKQAKDSWYQSQLFRNIWEEPMKAQRTILDDLAKGLGDHHDLTLLEGFVAAQTPDERLTAALTAVRQSLEENALSVGRRIYTERPRDFAERMSAWWKEWYVPTTS